MYVFDMYLECPDRFSEVLREELDAAELTVEQLVSQILLNYFGMVFIEDVSIHLSSGRSVQRTECFIHIFAQCLDLFLPSIEANLDEIELVLENNISCVLIELFGAVNVEKVMVSTK